MESVHWSWPAMLGWSGSMGIGCIRFWPRKSAIALDTCCNCSLESNDVVVCSGATWSMGMGADWAWGLAAIAPWWYLGCLLDLVDGWAGSLFLIFGMPNCSECKNKTKIYQVKNRKNASIRQKLRVYRWTCCCLHADEAYTNPHKSTRIIGHRITFIT